MLTLIEIVNTEIEDETVVRQALDWFEKDMDFADALHVASAGENEFATFDGGLGRTARRLRAGSVRSL